MSFGGRNNRFAAAEQALNNVTGGNGMFSEPMGVSGILRDIGSRWDGVQQQQPQLQYVEPSQQVGFYQQQMPTQISNWNNAGNIVDPSLLAQQMILGRAMQQYQPMQPSEYQNFYPAPAAGGGGDSLLIPDWRDKADELNARNVPLPYYQGGGGDGYGGYGGYGYDSVTGQNMGVAGYTGAYDEAGLGSYGLSGTATGSGEASDAGVSGANSEASHDADGNNSGGGGSSDSKIVCTAMNNAYGFGSFRNAIWLAYASKHLTKYHEIGYHAMFMPLVDFGFKRGDGKLNMAVRHTLEWIARHRSVDLRAEMRNKRRDPVGRALRFVLEPLCYVVGKFKGN